MDSMRKTFEDSVSRKVKQKYGNNADTQQNKKRYIFFLLHCTSLHCKHERTRQACNKIDEKKIKKSHMCEAQQITKRILGKTGNEKKDKGNIKTFMSYKIIKLFDIFFLDYFLDKLYAERSGNPKCY